MSETDKDFLLRYLRSARGALVWKLDGLSESQARMPHTGTGTNLAGLVKHAAQVEIGYFGETFGRRWPDPAEVLTDADAESDPNIDLYLAPGESVAQTVEFYRRVWDFVDETFARLPLDAIGRVAHWPDDRASVTLEQITVHVISDLARHAGHADILREQLDGEVGMRADNTNIPDGVDWPAHVARLTKLAEKAD